MGDEMAAVEFIEVLYRLNRTIVDDARAHVAEVTNLDVSEFMMLRLATSGVDSPGELARQLSTHPTAASRTITALVRAGFLHRVSDTQDARRLMVEPTDEGRRVVALIAQRIRPELQRRFDRIGTAQVEALLKALGALLQA